MEKYFIVSSESKLGCDYNKYLENSEVASQVYKDLSEKYNIESDEFVLSVTEFSIVPTENDIEKFSNQCKKRNTYVDNDTLITFKANSKIAREWVDRFIKKGIKSLSKPHLPYYIKHAFSRASSWIFTYNSVIYGYIRTNGENLEMPEGCTEIKGSEYHKILEELNEKHN